MSRYVQVVKEMIPIAVDEEDLVTLMEAAHLLNITVQGVAGAIDGGAFKTEIIDTEAPPRRGRRRLLRVEVMERKYSRC